jgi:hypothetical protein
MKYTSSNRVHYKASKASKISKISKASNEVFNISETLKPMISSSALVTTNFKKIKKLKKLNDEQKLMFSNVLLINLFDMIDKYFRLIINNDNCNRSKNCILLYDLVNSFNDIITIMFSDDFKEIPDKYNIYNKILDTIGILLNFTNTHISEINIVNITNKLTEQNNDDLISKYITEVSTIFNENEIFTINDTPRRNYIHDIIIQIKNYMSHEILNNINEDDGNQLFKHTRELKHYISLFIQSIFNSAKENKIITKLQNINVKYTLEYHKLNNNNNILFNDTITNIKVYAYQIDDYINSLFHMIEYFPSLTKKINDLPIDKICDFIVEYRKFIIKKEAYFSKTIMNTSYNKIIKDYNENTSISQNNPFYKVIIFDSDLHHNSLLQIRLDYIRESYDLESLKSLKLSNNFNNIKNIIVITDKYFVDNSNNLYVKQYFEDNSTKSYKTGLEYVEEKINEVNEADIVNTLLILSSIKCLERISSDSSNFDI